MSVLENTRQASSSLGNNHVQPRRQSEQYSDLARIAIMSSAHSSPNSEIDETVSDHAHIHPQSTLMPPPKSGLGRSSGVINPTGRFLQQQSNLHGAALTDTPTPSAPTSPQINPRGNSSGSATPKIRATTLDIPGLTRSKVSPDGRISERDVASKLVILMVGLPARGKSYLVKKIARYLNWLQHPTKIFNVGDRRRVAAGGGQTVQDQGIDVALRDSVRRLSIKTTGAPAGFVDHTDLLPPPALTEILVNDEPRAISSISTSPLQKHSNERWPANDEAIPLNAPERMDQSAQFFDPENTRAKLLREQVAHDTLDDLLKYVLEDGGSVGILDATNHTQDRRMSLMRHIRDRDQTINILFLESRCQDQNLLEANMRLKLSGPDYRGKNPFAALKDFQERVGQYEKSYQSLGDFEENQGMSYCSLIDVGRKMVSHQVNGFLSVQTVTYLMNFNLAPRQIWLTRHGESMDNVNGKIGGDSSLSPMGTKYAKALVKFIAEQREAWEQHQIEKQATTHFPPRPGDTTPPNPEISAQSGLQRNFCVWTSMLKRSIETSQYFNEDDYDLKQMRMLDELNAGKMEGLTYEDIKRTHQDEYELRKLDKLHYRYPGPGGEGYLDIINRLRKVILEVERMTDHVLIIGHRSIIRVLLAYFKGLKQEDISDLEVPLGVAYMLEPRPYGVDFKAYRWDPDTDEFHHDCDFEMRRVSTTDAN